MVNAEPNKRQWIEGAKRLGFVLAEEEIERHYSLAQIAEFSAYENSLED